MIHRFIKYGILLLVVMTSCGRSGPKQGNERVSPQVFADAIRSDTSIVLIDVRSPKEMQRGFISGAVNMDFNGPDFEKSIDDLDRNKNYFIYCASGKRSDKAQQLMKKKGFTHTTVLEGGLTEWVAAGLPVNTQ